jgi:mannose-6-phosphate isomerase-like protein (cupin superfamily)
MVLGSSDLPPGDAIGVHRHLREDEILLITRGTARVQLGTQMYTAGAGGTVFIPQGTCIAVENVGAGYPDYGLYLLVAGLRAGDA